MTSAAEMLEAVECLYEGAQGCGYTTQHDQAYELLKAELVSNPYRLRDARLLAASWQPVTPWSRIDHAFYFNMAGNAYETISEDPTFEQSSIVGLASHPDDAAVDLIAEAMKEKLRYSREVKGRDGWNDPQVCSLKGLWQMLTAHVEKGDVVDIANFAAMIYSRQQEGLTP